MEEDDEYFRCRTCGEYFLKSDAVNKVFCSNVCATKYTRCENCGKFFTKTYKTDDNFCSDTCRERYDEYIQQLKHQKKEGDLV